MIFYGVYFSIVNTIGVEIEMDDLSCMEEIVHLNLGMGRKCSSLSVISATWGILRAKVKRRQLWRREQQHHPCFVRLSARCLLFIVYCSRRRGAGLWFTDCHRWWWWRRVCLAGSVSCRFEGCQPGDGPELGDDAFGLLQKGEEQNDSKAVWIEI